MSWSSSQDFLSSGSLMSSYKRCLPQDRSASECSLRSAPLTVSVEELRSELSRLGFTSVPQQRLLQFKQDLEFLMRSRAALEASSGDTTDPMKEGEVTSSSEGATPSWDKLSEWPSSASSPERALQAPAHRGGPDSYAKHTVSVGAPAVGKPRAPVLTRKVLRRKSDGQVEVCDESLLSTETEPEGSRVSCGELQAAKSLIRIPPYSLLEQYRRRSDPVGRYQEYKQSWDALQVSLEKNRKELRWWVRERMMSAPPLPLPRTLPTPNSYVIPTEKKRYGLRWAIRQDLVRGNIPRGNYS
ncbi:centriolar and ciliogenesis-associated protein HYLS1 [Eleutherodactylus coqui]|uniref:centriolar and ciliogenesis-associated protein HYLS1 n=1 Tax=Eleutherodactylus coqui TaxID=57060 RepID=UPI0034628015